MPIDKPASTALVRVKDATMPDPSSLPHYAELGAGDVIPMRAVDLVTEEDKRYEEQLKPKAALNPEFMRRAPIVYPPLAPGATVNCESLLGFLTAIEMILPPQSNYPILSSAKLVYHQDGDRLYLEAGSHAVWTLVAIKAQPTIGNRGYTVVLPVQRARNVLTALRDLYPSVVVGVDELGVCLGPNTVPFGGPIEDFPAQPVMDEWLARAAMPASYFREICSRVIVARSHEFTDPVLHGVLLDFEHHVIDGVQRVLCTAVATDGARIHILRLPQMIIEVKQTHVRALPPTTTVPVGFFQYMREVIQHEWAAVEFCKEEVIAKGEDFVVVAQTSPSGRSAFKELTNWRKTNAEWPGYWLASCEKLEQLLRLARLNDTTDEVSIEINARHERMILQSSNGEGDNFKQTIQVRCFEGPAVVNVRVSIQYLLDALGACLGGLVRLAFTRDIKDQPTSPIVIRGESEQFKAIIMPLTSQ